MNLRESVMEFIEAYQEKYQTQWGQEHLDDVIDPRGFHGPMDEEVRRLIRATLQDMDAVTSTSPQTDR